MLHGSTVDKTIAWAIWSAAECWPRPLSCTAATCVGRRRIAAVAVELRPSRLPLSALLALRNSFRCSPPYLTRGRPRRRRDRRRALRLPFSLPSAPSPSPRRLSPPFLPRGARLSRRCARTRTATRGSSAGGCGTAPCRCMGRWLPYAFGWLWTKGWMRVRAARGPPPSSADWGRR